MEFVVLAAVAAVGWFGVRMVRRDYRELKQHPEHRQSEAAIELLTRSKFGGVLAVMPFLGIVWLDAEWLALPYLAGVIGICLFLIRRQGNSSR